MRFTGGHDTEDVPGDLDLLRNLPTSVSEQRVFRRLSVQLSVGYVVSMRRGEPFWGDGHTLDLSAGGMLLAVPGLPHVVMAELLNGDSEIEVAFALAADRPKVVSRCRVVWMRTPTSPGDELRLGLRFVDLEIDVRDVIHAFVSAHAT